MERVGPRILAVAIRAIGDVVLITPHLRLLKERTGASSLTVLVDGASADVLAHNPCVDRVVRIDRRKSRQLSWGQHVAETWSLIRALRAERYDIAVDLYSGPRSAALAWMSGSRHRYGEDVRDRARGYLYNHRMAVIRDGRHLVEQKLDLITELTGQVKPEETALEVVVSEAERQAARDHLNKMTLKSDRLVALIPGAGSPYRRWPAERFARVGDELNTRYGAQVLLLGGPEDQLVCRQVVDRMTRRPVDLSGTTSLRQSVALLNECQLVITNVTGPMHLAVALNQPKTIALYGQADLVQYAPWGTTASVVTRGTAAGAYWRHVDYRLDFEEFLLQVTVEDVLGNVARVMPVWQ